ncbi:MAG: VWA domain-containing protein, partial [Clostridiaceae bacterium]|nr:VWA domain-containing protein [Clostridiaceae bacterium]
MRSILDVCCVADRNSGSFICPLYNVEAKAIVDGNMAEVTLIQNFVNTGRKSIEALYTFPLIHNAQITGFKAQIGENQVVGAFKEKEEAFRDYNDAISKGDSAFLFESHRPDIFQISLGNIAVGERVTISITYLEEIKIVDNELRWIFPTVLAPRYIPGRVLGKKTGAGTVLPTDRVPDADYIILPVGEGYFTLKMTITVKRMEGIKKISSPSHPIEISIEKNSYLITFAREMELLDSDFVLSLLVEDIQRNSYIIGTRDILISAKYSTSDSTFMEVVDEHHDMEASMDGRSDSCENTVSTNNSNSSEHVNSINNIDTGADTGTDEKENLPDNSKKNADEVFGEIKLVMDVDWYEQEYNNYQYIFMIDVSGSMAGEKLEQAKRALKIALRNLVEGDQFNIIAFESTYQYFSESPEDYSQESLMRADEWIGKLQSMGGTEIYKPLNFILQKFNDDADYRSNPGKVIYLFTDGQVGNEKEVIRLVSQYSHLISLYPFGIDTAVNKYFIDSLAEIGNGMPEYIYPGERIEEKVIRQFSRMHQPYMENPQITGKEGSYLEAMPPL